jgi:streptogramin lyase
MNARITAAFLAAALFAGCSAAGINGISPAGIPGANGASDAASKKKHHRARGYARFIIPHKKIKRGRHGHFVSGATQSASIVAASTTGGTVTTVADLSGASTYCTGGGNARTCTVPVSVPYGEDTITITTYDQAPSGGQIPPSANELGIGSATQDVVNGSTPSIAVFLSGLIGSLGVTPNFASLPADGNQSTAIFVVDPRDFGNKKINAGTSDPYANPINVTLTETGSATSHAQLLKNGTPTGASAVLKYSTDTIALQYDGAGKPGYSTSTSLKAQGVPAQTAEVSPLYVTAGAIRSHILGLNGTISNPQLAISEVDAPPSTTYTATQSGCASIANPSAVSGTGPSATFNVAGGSVPSASGCTISVTDSNASGTTLQLPATNTPITGTVTIGGVTLTDYDISSSTSTAITLGPDGNMWIVEPPSNVGVLNPANTATLVADVIVPSSSLQGVATGSDGAVWASDQTNGGADRIVPNTYGISSYPLAGNTPTGITASTDGSLWIGSSSQTTIPGPGAAPTRLAQAPDGAIWFTEGQNIGRMKPSSNEIDEVPAPSSTTPYDLCVEPDGSVWFTSNGSSAFVSEITGTHGSFTIASSFPAAAGASLTGIACGVDNAIWYLDASASNNDVGRISLNAGNAQTTYTIPDANFGARFITLGPDGTLWYTSANTSEVGQVNP